MPSLWFRESCGHLFAFREVLIKIVTLFVTPYCPLRNGQAMFNGITVNDPKGSNDEIPPNETLYAR